MPLPAGPLVFSRIIPQVVSGSFDNNVTNYITIIQIVNTGGAASVISADFLAKDGTASTLSIQVLLAGVTTTFTGTMPPASLPVNGILVLTADAGTDAPGTTNWARIRSTAAVAVAAAFESRSVTTNALLGRLGLEASAADMTEFVIPCARNAAIGLDAGFAMVNTGSTTARITATLYDASGNVRGFQVVTLAPGNQKVQFASDLFVASLLGQRDTNYFFLDFSSDTPSIAAVSLVHEGDILASIPVVRLK